MQRSILILLISSAGLLLSSCNSGSTGKIDVALTDTPADDAAQVVVEFTGVKFQQMGGSVVSYSYPKPLQIDLAQLQDGVTTPLLRGLSLPAGQYQWMEFEVSASGSGTDSFLVLNSGGQHALALTPTGQVGLRINTPFEVPADSGNSFVVDFDARKSVLNPMGLSTDYRLQPVLRMAYINTSSDILGIAPAGLVTSGCTPVVYVYAGNVANPHDLNDTAPASTQPIVETPVRLNSSSGQFEFTAAFLPAGTYTLAFTCDAALDDPAKADTLSFHALTSTVTVPGQTTVLSLQ